MHQERDHWRNNALRGERRWRQQPEQPRPGAFARAAPVTKRSNHAVIACFRVVNTGRCPERPALLTAHNLNNLFMIILGRSLLLLRSVEGERWTPAELTAGLRTIADAVTRGRETLKRLRALTRESPDEGVTRLDVNALVREVVASPGGSVAAALADVPVGARAALGAAGGNGCRDPGAGHRCRDSGRCSGPALHPVFHDQSPGAPASG